MNRTMNKRNYIITAIIALVVTLSSLGVYHFTQSNGEKTLKIEHINSTPASQTLYTVNDKGEVTPLDFTETAEKVMDAVVHIKSTQTMEMGRSPFPEGRNPFEEFFKDGPFKDFFEQYQNAPRGSEEPPARVGQGSGVIISEDGYIVTNNHVVANATDLEVTLFDNRTYKATLVGSDPTTDLALIQIQENNLSTLPFVDSDKTKVGEWVLAVGNPFNLTSTVTAGIISAKGRNINILREQYAVESFIQTDAAINPGNSGGALVNLQGGLIGINTAIASPTGAYSGYGFAVPTNIVKKVVEDLIEYGVVQRGVLGVMIRTVDGNLAKDKELAVNNGAYVDSLMANSAAEAAGIETNDVIVAVDGVEVTSSPELQEIIAQHRPGDEVVVTVNRDGKERQFDVILNNRTGNTEIVKKEYKDILNVLGADVDNLDQETAQKLDLKGGVKVKKLYPGKIRKHTNMREGFIITKADGKRVDSVKEFVRILEETDGGLMLEGVYEDVPGKHYYAFGMDN